MPNRDVQKCSIFFFVVTPFCSVQFHWDVPNFVYAIYMLCAIHIQLIEKIGALKIHSNGKKLYKETENI